MMGLGRGAYGYGCDYLAGGTWGVGGIFHVAFWGLVALGVVLLVVWAVRSRHHAVAAGFHHGATVAPANDALETARTRLAKGEITPEEYERILPLLK